MSCFWRRVLRKEELGNLKILVIKSSLLMIGVMLTHLFLFFLCLCETSRDVILILEVTISDAFIYLFIIDVILLPFWWLLSE